MGGAPCAVIVAPDELPACRDLRHIGVGIDGSPESGVALELARLSGANVQLLAVVSEVYAQAVGFMPPGPLRRVHAPAVDSHVGRARAVIDEALTRCEGVTASGDVIVGDPVTALSAFGE